MRWSLGARLRNAWQRLPNVWYVRGLVIVLGVLCLLGPVGWGLVLLTEKQRERECLAAGSDWLWGDCVQVYQDCEVAGARYPLGTSYSDGCNVCRCERHGSRCTSKYCSKYTPNSACSRLATDGAKDRSADLRGFH